MKRLKLMTIVGARSEIIKMSAIVEKTDKYFDHVLMYIGQNYDYNLNEVFFKDPTLRAPNYYLGVVDNDIDETMGSVISKVYDLMAEIKPDVVIVLGDINSCLLTIAAKRLKIPVFYMGTGNRRKDENFPEGAIRRIIDITPGVSLCYSGHIRRYILQSGVKPECTYIVGSPMAKVLSLVLPQIEASNILNKLGLEKSKYIPLSAHREENIDIEQDFFSLTNVVSEMARTYNMLVLYSHHPCSGEMIEERNFKLDERIIQHRPFGFFGHNKLQQNAFCAVFDSGTAPEEGAFFHFPAVSARASTERLEAMDKGVFTIGNITPEAVCQAVELATATHANGDDACPVPAYTDDNVFIKIIKLIQSHVGIINRMVWCKS